MRSTYPQQYHAHGKLLLTGEYVVLDGATALAIPTGLGQTLSIHSSSKNGCHWISKDVNNHVWLDVHFGSETDTIHCSKAHEPMAKTLLAILQHAQQLNPKFNPFQESIAVETQLEFPRNWGLGSSSTLLYNIAQWAQVDPVKLLRQSFGGSGYDVAVAQYKKTILFTLSKDEPQVISVSLPWNFKDQLFFVHLNKKQDSKEGISHYKKLTHRNRPIDEISRITHQIASCEHFELCMDLFREHEALLSQLLELPTVQSKLFPDFKGVVKSLGAWGGDFVLVGGNDQAQNYFRNKGYKTIIPFKEMIL